MTTKAEAKVLYEGKYFYKVIKNGPRPQDSTVEGPFDNIYYLTEAGAKGMSGINLMSTEKVRYKFVQIVDGTPVQVFTEDEILVTTGKL